ncbi:UPF0182 family protein [Clostridium sp. D2Q-11]|uniref:UPF0182 protein GOQ27_11805 n=1 Tax=Anaeromonas frigoriresistens TaxID=2683708 RepID=A0A942Z741_9FIRM|nr:UPF0182 family protein [Anaeromonas frigoriresistens]MBS4539151.1 UPF0182 family protein [Anaeromonas frigoriresistens]
MRDRTKFILFLVIAILLVLFSSFTSIVGFITDYKWFDELGYTETFLTKLSTQVKIGVPLFIILFGLIYFYFISSKRNYYKEANITPPKPGEKRFNIILAVISAFISLLVSSIFAGGLWLTTLEFMNASSFGLKDPIFNNDIGLYVFKIPLFKEIISLILFLLFVLIIATAVFYLLLLSIRRPNIERPENVLDMNRFKDKKNIVELLNKEIFKKAIFKIGIFAFFGFLLIAINYYLKTFDLLYSPRGVAYGASYTDVTVTLWGYRIMAILAILSAITALVGAYKRNLKTALSGPALLVAVGILSAVGAGLIQQFIVEPDEISKEREFIQYNIDMTQEAYGLNNIIEKEFPVDQKLTKEDILNNEETIENIRINDYRPLKQVYNELQGIRYYYKFNDVDTDRYMIDGEYTQVFLSAREMDSSKLKTKTWINEHLKYTHGYGFVLSPVNSVAPNGQPELLVRSIPPTTDTDLRVDRPEIYFGEITNNYIVVNTDETEFDYPQGSDNVEVKYEGTAGVPLNGFNKILFAIRERNLKILISGNVNSDSKIIINRNIVDRVNKIAPFLEYDKDPYIVSNQENGKLYWIIDAYTTTNAYPYSQPYSEETSTNYIRNSVKVVVDAYNGETNFYIFDEEDPMVNTYSKIFPDLFKSSDKMPEGLFNHVRYPQTLFSIQSKVYEIYHMDNPVVFYNSEDAWNVGNEIYMGEEVPIEPNYMMFKLPDSEKAEFLLTLPYTPATKPNMSSLFVARNDGEEYGNLYLYRFPKGITVNGPMLVESKIDQDSDISPQLTLWSQEGSNVLRGNILTIPIENSLLYVEPVYIQASNKNNIPEMKRVIVAYKNQIVMEQNLDTALSKIFGQLNRQKNEDGVVTDVEDGETSKKIEGTIQNANEIFKKAKEASQKGDWAKYGEYIEELEGILNELNKELDIETEETTDELETEDTETEETTEEE